MVYAIIMEQVSVSSYGGSIAVEFTSNPGSEVNCSTLSSNREDIFSASLPERFGSLDGWPGALLFLKWCWGWALKMRTGITFGTFDLLHVGHVRILERSKALCDKLIVGVSSDALNQSKKNLLPIFNERDRMEIVRSLRSVDDVFLEESLDLKRDYVKRFSADVLMMGDDWAGRFDFCKDLCEVIYLPRTPNISTTQTKANITNRV